MNIIFRKGAIDALAKKLGVNKTAIYRKEEGAVISNKTMKIINDGEPVSLNTYKKLQKKYKLQQGVDIHFRREHLFQEEFSSSKNIFTTSYPKSLWDSEFAKDMASSNYETMSEYMMGKEMSKEDEIWQQESEQQHYQELEHEGNYDEYRAQLEYMESEKKLRDKNFIETLKKEEVSEEYFNEANEMLSTYEYYLNLSQKKYEITKIPFHSELTIEGFYFVENPDKFYMHLLAENNQKSNNEWLIDHEAMLNASCNLDDEQKLQLLQEYSANSDIKIDKAFFKKITRQKESQSIKDTLKILATLIDETSIVSSNTTSSNIEQLFDFGQKSIENSFWFNFYILELYGLQIYFKKIMITEQEETVSSNTTFNDRSKFIFYISSKRYEDTLSPALRIMPLGFKNFVEIPEVIPDELVENYQNWYRNDFKIPLVSEEEERHIGLANLYKRSFCRYLGCSEDDFDQLRSKNLQLRSKNLLKKR